MLLRLQFLSLVLIVKNWMTIVHVVQVAVNPKQVANVDIKIPLKHSCVTQGMSDIHVGFWKTLSILVQIIFWRELSNQTTQFKGFLGFYTIEA